jgi:hypothetical protein
MVGEVPPTSVTMQEYTVLPLRAFVYLKSWLVKYRAGRMGDRDRHEKEW